MRLFSLLSRVRSDEALQPAFRRPKNVARVFSAMVVLAALILLTAPQYQVRLVQFEEGRPMSENVVAQFPVEDPVRTAAQLRDDVAAVGKIYLYESPETVSDAIAKNLDKLVQLTNRFEDENKTKPAPERASYVKLSNDVRDTIRVNLSSSTLQILSSTIRSSRFVPLLTEVYRDLYNRWVIVEPIYADDLATKLAHVVADSGQPMLAKPPETAKTLVYPNQVRDRLRKNYASNFSSIVDTRSGRAVSEALYELALSVARPNLTFQPGLTEERRNQVRANKRIIYFQRGEPVIARGQIPTGAQIKVLEDYNRRIRAYRLLRFGAYLVLTLGMLSFLTLYARRFRPLLRFRTSSIVLIGIPLLVVLFVGRVAVVFLGDRYGAAAGYLFPAALVGILGGILLDTELAIIHVLTAGVLVGLATSMSFEHMIPALFGGMAAIAGVYRLRQRGQLFRAAIYVALVNILAIGVLHFIEDPSEIYYGAVAWGTINAVLCYLLATGMVPLFETVFGITTDLKLLELTAGHHPLLLELEEKAPGSYQHSLNVAKLAEAAADAIGANYLLVRAGAFFHDIGKAIKPRYFSENQISPDERRTHEKLSPFMSCLIIRNHVKDGIEMARQYGLPDKVVEFIPQHHGTCLIKYFYYEAVRQYEESESAEPVRQSDFRYPGPKPQSIEAAIVMLADSVEAIATNRLTRPNVDADDIRRLVIDAIQDKFSDGQMDECHLTLRQLHDIRESMVHTLVGRFHHRVDYPSPVAVPARKVAKESAVA